MKFSIFCELHLPKPWQADNHQCWKQSVLSGETVLEDLDTAAVQGGVAADTRVQAAVCGLR